MDNRRKCINCNNCNYWEENDNGENPLGDCHRYALRPKWSDLDEIGDKIRAEWPQTDPDDWCGEFQAKSTT